jgi:SNF2 family DNA or RNA helicase
MGIKIMNLHFINVHETEENGQKYLIQKANVTNNSAFFIRWKQAYRQDLEAKSLRQKGEKIQLPFNIRRFLALTTQKIDGEVHQFCIRKILKETEFLDPKLTEIKCDYVPRNTSGLLPFQLRAFNHLANCIINESHALDASDTGLGKTYIASALCREFYLRPIVLCRKIAIGNWLDVLKSFGVHPFGVINWEFMIREHIEFYKNGTWKVPPNCLLIFDEAHYANNEGTKNNRMYEASKGIPSLSLTATAADKPQKLGPILHVLGAMEKQEFEKWRKKRGEFENVYNQPEAVSEADDMRALNRLIFPRFGYRLRYVDPDVKEAFPDAIYNTTLVKLTDKSKQIQNKAYDDLIEKIKLLKEEKPGQDFQAAKLVEELRYRQLAEILKVDSFVLLAQDYIQMGFSVIIFVNFRETLDSLATKLKTDSLIYGDQENKGGQSRSKVIDDFQNDRTRLIIAMGAAAGTSISLHDVTGKHQRISFISPTYTGTQLKQILGRTYRANAKTPPIMSMVFAAGTVEEKVAHSVNGKLNNISAINDGDLMSYDTFGMEQ